MNENAQAGQVNNTPKLVIEMKIKIFSNGFVEIAPMATNYHHAKSHCALIEKAIDLTFMKKAMEGELTPEMTIKESNILKPTPGQVGAINNAGNN